MNRNKRIFFVLLTGVAGVLCLGSCSKSSVSYANELKAEKKLIEQYIKRNNISIIYSEPEYGEWKENEYLELADYCYFHLTQMGDTNSASLGVNDRMNIRYRQYTLTENADTVSYWNTNEMAYPLVYTLTTLYSANQGWYMAVQKLKYSGAQGKLICPSKLGANSSQVVPYGYDLKMQISRY